MSSRTSKGCLPCRTRKVKCDEGRPSCRRCIQRGELCIGYREEVDRFFRHETEKTKKKSLRRCASFVEGSSSDGSMDISYSNDQSHRNSELLSGLSFPPDHPGRKSLSTQNGAGGSPLTSEEPGVSQFFDKYVHYPCNPNSMPGFLEHLPSLFKDDSFETGRHALRWAVRAAASASLACDMDSDALRSQALQFYGQCLNSLGKSLGDGHKLPNDYELMTVVVLDLFESIFLNDNSTRGSHAQGMAQILRLRGPDQIHNPRGWSLFRLAHHRLLKQQLAFKQPPMPESDTWLASMNTDVPSIHTEKDNLEIAKICQRARDLLANIDDASLSSHHLWQMIQELLALDEAATTWRNTPEWSYKILDRNEIILDQDSPASASTFTSTSSPLDLPETLELHPDIWMAYEWNYHRTARIILHEHLIQCLNRLLDTTTSLPHTAILPTRSRSQDIIRALASQILSTVPQSLGDIDHRGRVLTTFPLTNTPTESSSGSGSSPSGSVNSVAQSKCTAIGAYFLLWPIKVVKATVSATEDQRTQARSVFQRIRECTGMKDVLGGRSDI